MYGSSRIYKKIEVIGVSKKGIEDAIAAALAKAKKTVHKMSWFEVVEIHGHIGEDGTVNEYQVLVKIAFQLED
ncbi:MAG TPA: dodecin [Geobacteraceae bacterium]|nr:dodecin [Geobacteraceae bacterium]